MHSHTNNRRRERESARGRDRAKEGSNRSPRLHIVRPAQLPGTRGEGQWEPGESRHVRALKCSAHEAVCMQLSLSRAAASCRDACPLHSKRPAPSATTGRPIVLYLVRADRRRPQHVSAAGSGIASPTRQDCSFCHARVGYSICGSPRG
jgi:hypothetical protein